MSRLSFDVMPEEMPEQSRRILDASFRDIRNVLDAAQGGLRLREQFAGVIDCVIDTAILPVTIAAPRRMTRPPLGVRLISATVQRTSTGRVLSGGQVDWEWRAGAVVIHSITGLAATTRYDAVIALEE